MGVSCSNLDQNTKKVMNLRKKYPDFHINEKENQNNHKIDQEKLKKYALSHVDHVKNFQKFQDEIHVTNKVLYDKLFTKAINFDELLEVKDIQAIDEDKILFFLNKSKFKRIKISDSSINFPKVNLSLIILVLF